MIVDLFKHFPDYFISSVKMNHSYCYQHPKPGGHGINLIHINKMI